MTKFYIDPDTNAYIGGFSMPEDEDGNEPDHPNVPVGAVEVSSAPDNAKKLWDGLIWSMPLDELKAERKIKIAAEANVLIDAQIGSNPRDQLMLVTKGLALLDAQVGRGGNPTRDPRQNQLADIFDYVELVNVAEQAAFTEIDDVATTDPSTVVLIHPPLPGA